MSNELKSYIGADPTDRTLTEYYLKFDVDKVIAEKDKEIAELKARIQLDDDEMAGFLDLEEECGGGDLRNYIAELKTEINRKEVVGQRWFERCMTERTENCRLRMALCRLRIGFAKHFGRVNSGKKIIAYWKAKAKEFKEAE